MKDSVYVIGYNITNNTMWGEDSTYNILGIFSELPDIKALVTHYELLDKVLDGAVPSNYNEKVLVGETVTRKKYVTVTMSKETYYGKVKLEV